MDAPVFISFATADRNYSDRIVTFLEAHHFRCWVSVRDVPAGHNYQEAITRAIRAAQVVVVLVSEHANSSAEILKELSLASRYKLRILPLRMENVEPGDALAYELATHQWIDMYRNWEAGGQRLLSELESIVSASDMITARSSGAATSAAGNPSPALARAIATPGGMASVPPGTFIPPRAVQAEQVAPGRAINRSGDVSPAAREIVAPVVRPLPRRGEPTAAVMQPRAGSLGLVKFVLVALTFGLLLVNSLNDGEPSFLDLFFWGILIIGCIRLIGAIWRVLTDGLRATRI